ncbi:phage gp6-like head-tail connector protein [Bradyrhizobium sp. 147]|uniref:head-tail connector protein n=1 Tax=Bradyrhizobium sp. 147 TaxID=2782623 RepID=UPI001FFC1817|nr:head-tail connector protein [Bradyrhizobium sp. 147]MCK1684254.1 phage gp6-like head-tail connector protein [Bradyrhizobium sp. 147]
MLKLIDVVAEAEDRPVKLEELKKHVNANDFTDDDPQLEIFLDAAIDFVAERTSLTLRRSSWRVDRCEWWSGCLQILLTPVRDVTVKYLDADGAVQIVAANLYRWERTDLGQAEIRFLDGFTSPALKADAYNAVQIEIEAGFDQDPNMTGAGDDPELEFPPRARQAVLMIAASWYRNREASSETELKVVPLAAEALLGQLRVYR